MESTTTAAAPAKTAQAHTLTAAEVSKLSVVKTEMRPTPQYPEGRNGFTIDGWYCNGLEAFYNAEKADRGAADAKAFLVGKQLTVSQSGKSFVVVVPKTMTNLKGLITRREVINISSATDEEMFAD